MIPFAILSIGAFVVYVGFALFNFYYLSKIITYETSLYMIGAAVISLPLILIKYSENKRQREMEKNFPIFLQDLVEALRGGMTLPQAFKAVSSNHYGIMTPLVKKMAAQFDWGIPAEKVLLKFAIETRSKIIFRTTSTIVESHRFGSKLTNTIEALSGTAVEVERMRAERKLFLNSQIITGYIIFFVFLAVIIGLNRFLVPSLGRASTSLTSLAETIPQPQLAAEYEDLFRNLILLEGLFAGLTVGKMSEGVLVGGVKHSFFMMVAGVIIFILFA